MNIHSSKVFSDPDSLQYIYIYSIFKDFTKITKLTYIIYLHFIIYFTSYIIQKYKITKWALVVDT